MPFNDETFRQLLGLLDQQPDAREELKRRLLPDDGTTQALRELAQAQARTEQHLSTLTVRVDHLGERVDQLAVRMDQLTARVDLLAARMDQLTARVDQLAVNMDHLVVRMDHLAVRMDELAAAQARTEAALEQLATSVAGMREQRRGDEYERGIRLDAITMFVNGDGGAPLEPHVRSRMQPMVTQVIQSGTTVEEDANPMRADLIWWKDGHFLVAEASIVLEARPKTPLRGLPGQVAGRVG